MSLLVKTNFEYGLVSTWLDLLVHFVSKTEKSFLADELLYHLIKITTRLSYYVDINEPNLF